ncbi:hypothetical protein, conserved [Eimeria necatrix]|uniref:Uncharacterized protein n=1 Tax=Eimeria necatrix TaxID=51315 RepID=U6MNV0_9EIME|nr:hypothetical protein, conserved [Eimeria necatrix]CDJ63345.1 hypothetical protein, conserved [Eimeria necatrix]
MATIPAETVPVGELCSRVNASSLHSSGVFSKLAEVNAAQQPEQRFPNPSMPTDCHHRPPAHLRVPSETERPHSNGVDASGLSDLFVGLLSLPKGVRWPPAVPRQDAPSSHFWQSDGSFSCDWAALKAGEAFCASVNATCAFCLSRALGGPSAMISALLSKLRAGAKTAVEEEISHLIQAVKTSAANAAAESGPDCSDQQQNSEDVTQQLLKHPALQAVAFMSVHERRMAVFEIWLDRWQVLSRGYHCTCGSAEAADENLTQMASDVTSVHDEQVDAKAAIEELRGRVVRQREESRKAYQEEESVVSEARSLSIELVKKQQQLLLATERVKALETVRRDPTFRIMESAQRQPPSASPDSLLSTGKECLSFIADKCNKLASLAQLMQQQPNQPQTEGQLQLSREAAQAVTVAGDADDAEEDTWLFRTLRGLQTPHASMHSPQSQRARASSLASVTHAKDGANGRVVERPVCELSGCDAGVGKLRQLPADDRMVCARLNRAAGSEASASPASRLASPASPDSRHSIKAPPEPGSNKRARRPDKLALRSRRKPGLLPSMRHAELDIGTDVSWQPAEHRRETNVLQDAVWIDSFLRRRPDA